MQPSLELSLSSTERLTALAVTLQTLELLSVRRAFADDGVWRWSILRDEHARLPSPLRWGLAVLSPYRSFLMVLALRLPLAVSLAGGVSIAAWPLCLSQLAVNARFRGTFNGGSDYMTMVLLLGLSASALPFGEIAQRAGLGYICAQLVLSYFIAGLVKLRRSAWRSGHALGAFLGSERYGTPPWLQRFVTPRVGLVLAWSVMVFELAFPLTLLRPHAALGFAALGLAFHAANAIAFGLNRFLFAWAAAYPALVYFSAALGES